MKRTLFLILLGFTLASAEINEYFSDVYFANGIDTSKKEAHDAKDKLSEEFKLSNPQAYQYTDDWNISYNHTHGIGIDLYESMLQKIDEDWRIKYALDISGLLKFTYGGIVKMVAKKVAKESIEEFTRKQAEKIARKIFVRYRPGDGTLSLVPIVLDG